jgi:hypothetical protein
MSRKDTSLFLVVAFTLAGAGQVRAEEKKIDKAAVPKPVLDAVARKYPAAKMVAFEQASDNGKTLYEVGIQDGKSKMDVEVTADGKIEVEETVIKDADVPAEVKAGLASSKYKGWKVSKIEKVIKQEKTEDPAYEFVVQSKKQKFEVVLDKSGKVTEEEDKSKSKEKDGD